MFSVFFYKYSFKSEEATYWHYFEVYLGMIKYHRKNNRLDFYEGIHI